jgi:hypothetical protein
MLEKLFFGPNIFWPPGKLKGFWEEFFDTLGDALSAWNRTL